MTPAPKLAPRHWVALAAILALALTLRLAWILVIEPQPELYGGDQSYYLNLGRELAGKGDTADVYFQASAPVYPLFVSLFFRALPEDLVLLGIRVGQAILDTAMCWLVFDLGARLFGWRAGLLGAGLLAADLRFIVQAGVVGVESFLALLLVLSTWAFVVVRSRQGASAAGYAGVGALYLLAAFVRAVVLPLPFLVLGSLMLPRPTRKQVAAVAATAAIGLVAIGSYAVYNYQRNGSWVIISDGFGGNFWMGSRSDGQWHGLHAFQQEIEELKSRYDGTTAYMEDAFQTIAADPAGYARLLAMKLASAYLQPFGTAAFPGASLKDLAFHVIAGRLSPVELVRGEAFWPKAYIYAFHYFGLVGGLAALWLARRRWLDLLPLTLAILWFTVIYTLLTIIPRYLFPVMPFYLLLASWAAIVAADFVRVRRTAAAPAR